MAAKSPKNLLGIPKRSSGKDLGYQKNQNLVKTGPEPKNFAVTRTKTDCRIGSVTPPAYLKGGLTVNNNSKVQSHSGGLGAVAAKHMSPSHEGGRAFSPRVTKARAMAKPNAKAYANPVNVDRPRLKPVKPE